MEFTVGERVYNIESLNPVLDQAFLELHTSFLSELPLDLEQVKLAAEAFFDESVGNWGAHDGFFNNFTIIWRSLLNQSHLRAAGRLWQIALTPALNWEAEHPGERIHKGTPFYFWGMTTILEGNLDRGYLLMHQALEEDRRTREEDTPDSAAYALVTLNHLKQDQAFRDWVVAQAGLMEEFIEVFCQQHESELTLRDFRERFLEDAPSLDTVFLFAYALGRLLEMQYIPPYALKSGFAGQLELNILFDLTLVVDQAISGKYDANWRFSDRVAFLATSAGLALTQNDLKQINGMFQDDFGGTLGLLLDAECILRDGSRIGGRLRDLAVAYGIRNRGAHHTSGAPELWQRFGEVKQSVMNALFMTVKTLYAQE